MWIRYGSGKNILKLPGKDELNEYSTIVDRQTTLESNFTDYWSQTTVAHIVDMNQIYRDRETK